MLGSVSTNVPRLSDPSQKPGERLSFLSNSKRNGGDDDGGNNLYVSLVVSFCAIGGILFGLDQANYGGAIVKDGFVDKFCYGEYGNETQAGTQVCNVKECGSSNKDCSQPEGWTDFISWGGSIIQLGAAAGALVIAPFITRRFGRRFALAFGSGLVSLSMLWCALAANIPQFLIARTFTGIGIGCVTYTLPMYNSELSPTSIRGILGTTMQLSCVIGSQIATGYNIPDGVSWQWSLAAPIVPALILCFGVWFMPPSPRFAMQKNGTESARAILVKLRGTTNVGNEVAAIQEAIEQEKEEQPYSVLFTDPSIRKRVVIANMLQWLQQFTGINAMVGYGPSVFIALGLPLDPNVANFTAQAFNLVGTVIMMTVIDKMGRRPLLISGAVVMFLTMFIAGIIQEAWNVEQSAAKAWIQFSLLCVYFLGFAIAWGGVPWVYPSEIFPMEIKEKALSTSVFSQWMANFVIAQIVQRLIASIGIGYTFIFFSAFLFLAIFYVYFFVPETKGVPLEDMDKLFGPRQYHYATAIPTPNANNSV